MSKLNEISSGLVVSGMNPYGSRALALTNAIAIFPYTSLIVAEVRVRYVFEIAVARNKFALRLFRSSRRMKMRTSNPFVLLVTSARSGGCVSWTWSATNDPVESLWIAIPPICRVEMSTMSSNVMDKIPSSISRINPSALGPVVSGTKDVTRTLSEGNTSFPPWSKMAPAPICT